MFGYLSLSSQCILLLSQETYFSFSSPKLKLFFMNSCSIFFLCRPSQTSSCQSLLFQRCWVYSGLSIIKAISMAPSLRCFFIYAFSEVELGLLVAMTLDQYVAIRNPLRHSSILTNSVVTQVGIVALLCRLVLMIPHLFLVRRWPYCQTSVVPHTYCEHMAVVKLACADIFINCIYSLAVIILTVRTDVACMSQSYIQILYTVFNLPSKDARLKTLSTCGFHVCVILAVYIPALFSFIIHILFSKHIS